MSGADVFTLDPDQVHAAVEDLFDIEAEVDTAAAAIKEESAAAASGLSSSGLATGDALDAAASWGHGMRAGGFGRRLGNMGEYLATCAEEAVEIDEYSAEDFRAHADFDRYGDRPNAQVATPANPGHGGL